MTTHPNNARRKRPGVRAQPKPRGGGPAVWDLVVKDMLARDRDGFRKYGDRLRSNNGRDALVDAYQEALDLAVYLRQAIAERDGEVVRVG